MTDQEKEQRIAELQAKKASLKPALEESFEAKTTAFRLYNELNFKWMDIRDQFEEFDREEKLLFFSMLKNQTKPTKRQPKNSVKEIQENAKKAAMKALEVLLPELREQILKQFK